MAYEGLVDRLAEIRGVVADRQARAGWRHPVRIVAITKSHPADAIRAALAAGLDDIGENRVQEALTKQAALPGAEATWHLVGSLQRNKARQAVGRFDWIHSVDRIELADELARRVAPGTSQRVLVEVNCAGEAQKAGVAAAGLGALLDHLDRLPALRVEGLMTLAPLTRDERLQRTVFARLRALRDAAARPDRPLAELSMGMSGDYPAAVEEGATMVRLGTLLFGERAS